jgi:hypothetical protein
MRCAGLRQLSLDGNSNQVMQQPGAPSSFPNEKGDSMLRTICVIVLVLWLIGFSLHVAGSLIHLLC